MPRFDDYVVPDIGGYYVMPRPPRVVQVVGGEIITTLATCEATETGLANAKLIARLLNKHEGLWHVRDVLIE